MTIEELRAALAINNRELSLTRGSLGERFDALLLSAFGGQTALSITEASLAEAGQPPDRVVIEGTSGFLGIPRVPLKATFWVDAAGQPQAILSYRFRDSAPAANPWVFSRSFPELPRTINYGEPRDYDRNTGTGEMFAQAVYLDSLDLYDTWFIASTAPGLEPSLAAPLEAGINFVSKLRPAGALGVLEYGLGSEPVLTLRGRVILPTPSTSRPEPLRLNEYVWNRPEAPGIHLAADLGLDFKLGKLSFNNASFRVYSPVSSAWQKQNPTFAPVQGYSAKLAIPSANIEVGLGADLQWNRPEALLLADCAGVSLGNLASLLDLTDGASLSVGMPDELGKLFEAVDKIELTRLGLVLSAFDGIPSVDGVLLSIGTPNLRWKVWGEHLVVEDLSLRFELWNPFTESVAVNTSLSGTVDIEGVPVSLTATSQDNFTVYARLKGSQTVPLKKMMQTYAPGIPAPADLTIDNMAVEIAMGRYFAFSALMAGGDKRWTVPVGPTALELQDVSMNLTLPVQGSASGAFGGKIAFSDGILFDTRFEFPGGFEIKGLFPRAKLSHLLRRLSNQSVFMPPGFDVGFESAAMRIRQRNKSFDFQLVTKVEGAGFIGFEAREVTPGSWGFAFGFDFTEGNPKDQPGMDFMATFMKAMDLRKLMLVLSTFDGPDFQFPDAIALNTVPASRIPPGKKITLPSRSGGVTRGLNLFAQWALDTGDGAPKILKKLLGLNPTLDVTIQVSDKRARLFTAIASKIQGQPLNAELGAEVGFAAGAGFNFFLTGSMPVKIQGNLQTFDVAMVVVPNGLFFSGNMRGNGAVKFGHLQLSDLGLEIGVSGQGLPSLGITATLAVGKFHSSLAVFFDSVDPSKSLLAGAVSDLTLGDVVGAMLAGNLPSSIDDVLDKVAIQGTNRFEIPGNLADSLDSLKLDGVAQAFQSKGKIPIPSDVSQVHVVVLEKSRRWHLTDLTKMRHYQLEKKGDAIAVSIEAQFYFAPAPTSIGSMPFPAGFYINGALDFLGYKAQATIDINASRGIAVDARMDKIVLLKEELFSLAAESGPGGPRLSISTYGSPHFSLNGGMTFLGLKRGVLANVSRHGVEFELRGALVKGVDFDVDARFGRSGLSASGRVKVDVGTIDLGALGKVKINTGLDVDIDIDITLEAAQNVSVSQGTWKPGSTVAENSLGELVFLEDGNLCWYDTTERERPCLWQSATENRIATRLEFQPSGNLVIYDNYNRVMWQSNSNTGGPGRLSVQGDGNVCIYDGANNCRWQTATRIDGIKDVSVGPGEWKQGNTVAKNALGELVFQQDGNLCFYDITNGGRRCLWQSATANRGAATFSFQGDSNLVIYDNAGRPLWNSKTQGTKANRLAVQADGNVCLYDAANKARWQTDTRINRDVNIGPGTWKPGNTVAKHSLGELVFQQDGNLCFYDTTSGGRRFLWQSATNTKAPVARLDFQSDGNLVIYDTANAPRWNSNTQGSNAIRLTVQTDGNVCLYDGANKCRWQTATRIEGGRTGASISLDTDLVFMGQKVDIPRFRVAASGDTFAKLPSYVEEKVTAAIKDIYKDATRWATDVANGVVDGVQDTEKVLKDVYKQSEKDAKKLANDTKKGIDKGVKAVGNFATSTGKTFSKGFKKIHF